MRNQFIFILNFNHAKNNTDKYYNAGICAAVIVFLWKSDSGEHILFSGLIVNEISLFKGTYGFGKLFLVTNRTYDVLHFFSQRINAFFISNTCKRRQAKIGKKKQANAMQHPEADFLLFEIYSHSSSKLSSKNYKTYPKE